MKVEPYLSFDGRCDEAIAFYKSTVGAKVNMLVRFNECPTPASSGQSFPPEVADKVMHANLRIGETDVLVSDGHCQGKPKFSGICLSLTVETDADAQKIFAALAEGGKITMPMAKTFFSSNFGMVDDRFGVGWMVIVGR